MLAARLLLGAVAVASYAALASPPHVLFILIDDWGWADVGWHVEPGQAHGVSTPNLDALLKQGVELDRHYSYKICSPSRTAIQSGRNPIHVSVTNTGESLRNPADPVSGFSAMPVNMTGMGEIMARGGYATHFYGKWDAGMATPFHTPLGRGYHKSLAYFHHRNDYWTSFTIPAQQPNDDTTCPGFPKDHGPRDLWEDDHPATDKVSPANCSQASQEGCKYEDQVFAQHVYDAILSHNTSQPLFVFWAPHAIHDPLEVPSEYLDRFSAYGPPHGRSERQHYLAIVAYIDEAIGHAIELLRARNMWNNTFVIVSSDNGGPVYYGGSAGANNWPLKGGKETNWEGGIRVNAFVSGGFLPPNVRGTKSDGLSAVWDWYATLARLAGVDPTDQRAAAAGLPPIDSHDLWPMLIGTNKSSREELAVGTDGRFLGTGQSFKAYVGALLKGRYKIIVQPVMPQATWTGPVWPNLTNVNIDADLQICLNMPELGCLYDVFADPYEHTNLAKEKPDLWKSMYARMKAIEATTFSPDRGSPDPASCTVVEKLYNGFWGPWAMLDAWPEARGRAQKKGPAPSAVSLFV